MGCAPAPATTLDIVLVYNVDHVLVSDHNAQVAAYTLNSKLTASQELMGFVEFL